MKAIAIDDEPVALDVVRSHASKVPYLTLKATFTDAFKALEYLQIEPVDLIFLDIKMPDISGIDFFNSLNSKPLLIFTTAYSEHAVTSYELDAVDYLLKPFSLVRFMKACNKAYELYKYRNENEEPTHIFIKSGYEQHKISFDNILYLEGAGNYVTFVLKDKKILTRYTFAEVMDLLPSNQFVRIHRSYIAAVNKIDKVKKDEIVINGTEIPVSDTYRKKLESVLNNYSDR